MVMKCHGVSWMGSWNSKRTLGETEEISIMYGLQLFFLQNTVAVFSYTRTEDQALQSV